MFGTVSHTPALSKVEVLEKVGLMQIVVQTGYELFVRVRSGFNLKFMQKSLQFQLQ